MRLKSLQISPQGSTGWSSDLLVFGDNITQLFGSNGCGKTPIIQAIVFCLGYPSIFRNDIYDKCNNAVLTVEITSGILILKRIISRDVDIEVTGINGDVQKFYNEKDYSLYLFELLNINVNNLVTNRNEIGSPYLASILPIFYLDQDDGYNKYYAPQNNFIKDQFSEMIRMIFGLPVKNSFDAKKARIDAKKILEYLDVQVFESKQSIEIAKHKIINTGKSSDELSSEIVALDNDLEQLKSSGASYDDSINVLDRLISSHKNNIRDISIQMGELTKRTDSIKQIIHDINTEIDTLNLNEEARRVFISFNEICGSSHCQLFSSSSDSYSKNLLYLKDQIKDLERNDEADTVIFDQFIQQKNSLEELIKDIVEERNNILGKSEISALVDTISEIKNQIFILQSQKNDLAKIEFLEEKYISILSDRDKALNHFESFSSSGSPNPDIYKLRSDLRQSFLNWLDILNTSNISKDITFKADFIPILGAETISQLKGSTRTRAVLAFHAAIIEIASNYKMNGFRFFILDTPKQHEIHIDDLDRYIKALKKSISSNRNPNYFFYY